MAITLDAKALALLNRLRAALDDQYAPVSAPGEAEPGEFYVTWDGSEFAVRVEVL